MDAEILPMRRDRSPPRERLIGNAAILPDASGNRPPRQESLIGMVDSRRGRSREVKEIFS